MPICLSCKKYVKIINYAHLKKCSNLSISEYKIKFPNTILWDDEVRKSCSRPGKLNGHWKDKKIRLCSKCNKEINLDNKTGLCIKCLRLTKNNFTFLGKKHSKKTRLKMVESAKWRDKSTIYKIPITKEIINKMKKTKKENWNKLTAEEKYNRLEHLMKSTGKKHCKTSIEEKINQVLIDFGMEENKNYARNVQIKSYNVDFLINNKFIINCYGDYWHKNPKYFNTLFDEVKRQKDFKRERYLKDKGFQFIYFWEENINKSTKQVIELIIKFLGQYYNIFEWEACSNYQG